MGKIIFKVITMEKKELQTQYSIINKYTINEHTLYSGLPSDPWEYSMEKSVHMYSQRTLGFRKDIVCHQVNKHADIMFKHATNKTNINRATQK